MRQILTVLLLCSFYFQVGAKGLPTQITIINKGTDQKIRIQSEENTSVVFDDFSDLEGMIELSSHEPFRLICRKKKSNFQYLYITLIIKPGEHIFVDNLEDSLYVYDANNDPVRNNELAFFSAMQQEIGDFEGFLTYIPHKRNDAEALMEKLDELVEERLSFLGTYKSSYPISPWFDSLLVSAFKYKKFYDFYDYCRLEGITVSELHSLDKYLAFEQEIFYQKELDNFIYFQEAFLSKLRVENPINSNNPNQYDIWAGLSEGQTREFTLFNLLGHLTRSKYMSEYLNTFYRSYPNSLLGVYSLTKFDEYTIDNLLSEELLKRGEVSCHDCMLNLETQVVVWDSLINDVGAVKYIDFWASWCGGCRASFGSVGKLQDEYKNQDFKVIFVSIDMLPTAWAKASEKEKLSNDDSFLFLNFDESSFKEKYSIPPIARYMLIDKKGKIVDTKAPHPFDPKLKEMIDELLKE